MPRIDGPTVVEHRRRQERALLTAAQELLLTDGVEAVTPAAVGAAVGLARSSVYKYFRSAEEILERLLAEAFTNWADTVREAVEAAPDARARIEAYVRVTLQLAEQGHHRIAGALSGVDLDDEYREQIRMRHRELMLPLYAALREHGDQDPETTAALMQGAVDSAVTLIDTGHAADHVTEHTLAFLGQALDITPGSPRGDPGNEGTR